MRPRLLVLGGGVAGLATALFLARRGQQVDLLERDRSAVPTGARAAGGWNRPTVPQGLHSHTFLAGSRRLLAEAPDVLAGLLRAGVREIPLRPPPTLTTTAVPAPELVALAARRSVVEWIMRRAVERERDVRVHPGTEVTGLAESGGRVCGVHVDGGTVDADIVVDATGRRSPIPGWLAARGRPVPERSSPCGLTYYSRYWVLHRTGDPGELNGGATAGASFDRFSCHVFPADNGTFSVTFAVPSDDAELGVLRSAEAFDAAAARIPCIARWTDGSVAVPISGVAVMSGLENRLRTLAPSGVAVLPGLLAVGDAGCTTDPAHSRGATLGLASALACATAVVEHGGDQECVTVAADEAQQELLEPWFEDSVAQDAARLSRWSPEQQQATPPTSGAVSHADAALAARRDSQVWAEYTALQNLLRRPDEVLARQEIARRVRAVVEGPWRPEPTEGPGRDELAAVLRQLAQRRPVRVSG